MSHEITDAQFDALQSLLSAFPCPCPSDMKWGAKNDLATFSNNDLTMTTTQGDHWGNARSSIAHCSGKRTFQLNLAPAIPNVEEIVVGFGTPSVDISEGGGGVHGGQSNAFQSWCIADDGQKTHGNEYADIGLASATMLRGFVDFDAGKVWFGNESGTAGDPEAGSGEAFEFTPNTPLYVVASIYVSSPPGSVSATLAPGYSSGSFAAW